MEGEEGRVNWPLIQSINVYIMITTQIPLHLNSLSSTPGYDSKPDHALLGDSLSYTSATQREIRIQSHDNLTYKYHTLTPVVK